MNPSIPSPTPARAAHTPGPLHIGATGITLRDKDSIQVALAGSRTSELAQDRANAERLALCWNEHDSIVAENDLLKRQLGYAEERFNQDKAEIARLREFATAFVEWSERAPLNAAIGGGKLLPLAKAALAKEVSK